MYHLLIVSFDPSDGILALLSVTTCTNRVILGFIGGRTRLVYYDILSEFQLMDDNSTIQSVNLTILGCHVNSISKNSYTKIGFVDLIPRLVY